MAIKYHIHSISRKLYNNGDNLFISKLGINKSHHLLTEINGINSKITPVKYLISKNFKSKNTKILSQNIFNIEFNKPIGLAAGYDKSGKSTPVVASLDLGFSTVGSVTAKKCKGNKKPWFYALPESKSIVVNAGLNNDGAKRVLKRIQNYNLGSAKKIPIILSVAKTNCREVVDVQSSIDDYLFTLNLAKDNTNINIIELNISCPNAYGGESFANTNNLEKLLKAIKKLKIIKPIIIKMPIYLQWSDFKDLLDISVKYGIKGVTISNLTKDRSIASQNKTIPDDIKGYLSGKPTWEIGNKLISKTFVNYHDKLMIIGAGGIFSAEDAYKKIKLGASLVETATGLIFCGPQFPLDINKGLVKLLKKDGFEHIGQAIGVEAKGNA